MIGEASNPPIDRHKHIDTRDVELANRGIDAMYGDTRIVATSSRFAWRATSFDLGPIAFVRAFWSDSLLVKGTPKVYVVSLSAGGVAQASQKDVFADVVANQSGGVASPGRPSAWQTSGEFSGATIRIEPDFLTTQLEALTGEVVEGPIHFDVPMNTGGTRVFLERLWHLVAGEMGQDTPLSEPMIASGLCESLARALLMGQPHNHSHLLGRAAPSSGVRVVRKVEEFVEANASEPVSLTDLTALTGASGRSIEAAFREHRGTTPASLLRKKRLERARQTLLADPRVSVTRVAHTLGFLHVETFEAAYFRAFKESPTETRRRGLTAVGASPLHEHREPAADLVASLSPRERQVCARVAQGMLNKQIAAELGTTLDTVKKQRGKAMKKLGVTSAVELARLMGMVGLVG
jgi:DNA-binding CsgD family transcriptional regulator/AraC-like DNA-binding protein